jgi:hypothetical protein
MNAKTSSNFRENSNTAVAGYESMLDLFTLISFTLILAAFLYATQAAQNLNTSTKIVSSNAASGNGSPSTLPKDMLLLIIYRMNSIDYLTIVDGASGKRDNFDVTLETLPVKLSVRSELLNRKKILNVAIHKGIQDVNPAIVLEVDRWLVACGRGEYHRYYE